MGSGLLWRVTSKESACNVETWDQSLGQEGSLEKEMTTHSGVLAWKSHGQQSLAGYSPCSCKRAGHDLETKQQ